MNQATPYKFEKPRILLIDMSPDCEISLRTEGYNVTVGTFGNPKEVPPSDNIFPISTASAELPNYEEQEIVIVSTTRTVDLPRTESNTPGNGVKGIWQQAISGVIDPRPFAMANVKNAFKRALEHGGIAIVMLGSPYEVEYFAGRTGYGCFEKDGEFSCTNTSFLEEFKYMALSPSNGTEVTFSTKTPLASLLKRGATNAQYACIVTPGSSQKTHWASLAEDKFGNCVAGVLTKDDPQTLIFVLPQMPEFHKIVGDLIGVWCAKMRPKLFPFHEGMRWQHSDEYELPSVIKLRGEISRVEAEMQDKIDNLKAQIDAERVANQDWYTLLNGTGTPLVAAVIRSLMKCGFGKVVDVDEHSRKEGDYRNLREDLQIHDQSPVLIVDIKGIAGNPEDSAATQSEKHALMRAKEFAGDVKPLTIINHQRNLPPHDRNPNPYRDEIVGNANQTGLGLMTAWDVFRLLRNRERLGWSNEDIKPIFYRTGRIEPIPEHYRAVGEIAHVWKRAIGVVPTVSIPTGSRIAIEVGDLFEEVDVVSLKVDDVEVPEASVQSKCGIECGDTSRYRMKMRVFLLTPKQHDTVSGE